MNLKIAKKLISLILCITMSFGVTVLGACSNSQNSQSSNNNGQDDSGNNINQNDDKSENNMNEVLKKYSKILQTVLTDKYYTDLLDTYVAARESQSTLEPDDDIKLNHKYYSACPLPFFKKQGHDITAIINGNLNCGAKYFYKNSEPNNLYCYAQVENIGLSFNYYTCYLLKYSVTEQEKNDIELLYGINGYAYIQAPLFMQELSNQKTPQILNKSNIRTKTANDIYVYHNYSSSGSIKTPEKTAFKNYIYNMNIRALPINAYKDDEDEYYLTLYLYLVPHNSEYLHNSEIASITLKMAWNAGCSIEGDAIRINYPFRGELINVEEISGCAEDVTFLSYKHNYNIINYYPN